MKTTMYLLLLLSFLTLHPRLASAQSDTQPAGCEYQKTWENPETFQGPSIALELIQQCLREKKPIKNHHIIFEDYRDAWVSLAKETKYRIPLLIEGGMLHA